MSEVTIHAQAILFDMDGVLVSSIASAGRCWRRWAKHYGVPDWENLEIPHGVRARDIAIHFKPDIDPDEGLKLIEDMEVEDTGDIVLLPGALPLLESLPKQRWTIVTSATKRLLIARLRAAKLPVPEELIAAEMVTHGKPHPEPYERGAELLGFPIASCIVVEDATSGVQAGKAAGARVLAVTGTHNAEELKAAGADWVVSSLENVTATAEAEGLKLQLTTL
ncbi:MAG: HAD-IA family hydrolase [Bryocella sp.]